MSYGRNPVHIWSDGENLNLWNVDLEDIKCSERVPEIVINAFLYKILLTNNRDDLKARLVEGKKVWGKKDQSYYEKQEDKIMKKLMDQ